MSISFDFDAVDKLTVGTVGPVGQRTFYLQARSAGQLVSLKVEKQQVQALARSLGTILADLPRPGHLPEDLELDEPVDAAWVVGTMQLGYDSAIDRVVLVAEEVVFVDEDEDEDDPELAALSRPDTGTARFAATREQVSALAIRSTSLVEAGRPPCPLCGHPLDPSGHACPRTNGNRPPTP